MTFLHIAVPFYSTLSNDGLINDPVPVGRFTACYNLGASEAEVAIPQGLQMKAGSAQAQTSDNMDADAGLDWFREDNNALG